MARAATHLGCMAEAWKARHAACCPHHAALPDVSDPFQIGVASTVRLVTVSCSGPLDVPRARCLKCGEVYEPKPVALRCFPSSPVGPSIWFDLRIFEEFWDMHINEGNGVQGFVRRLNRGMHELPNPPSQRLVDGSWTERKAAFAVQDVRFYTAAKYYAQSTFGHDSFEALNLPGFDTGPFADCGICADPPQLPEETAMSAGGDDWKAEYAYLRYREIQARDVSSSAPRMAVLSSSSAAILTAAGSAAEVAKLEEKLRRIERTHQVAASFRESWRPGHPEFDQAFSSFCDREVKRPLEAAGLESAWPSSGGGRWAPPSAPLRAPGGLVRWRGLGFCGTGGLMRGVCILALSPPLGASVSSSRVAAHQGSRRPCALAGAGLLRHRRADARRVHPGPLASAGRLRWALRAWRRTRAPGGLVRWRGLGFCGTGGLMRGVCILALSPPLGASAGRFARGGAPGLPAALCVGGGWASAAPAG
ncbi:hypothetical protein HYH03_014462 [Edaphochlamys debaryana]|uniref:Uncharacterized protein n=1 Tax=Edaphochlamys debaryana TaxID=47281 RepID=A0A836BTH3_9CHLO|nr:hypothetical protein HYH03_014462 [Edaphochlamys debaryana]|eukprot:KAG2486868.1 hypothetical protein HYH03_014462 [Edaphochlamys debaryana]